MAAGRVELMFTTYSSAKSFIDSGKIRLLAAGGSARMQSKPEVPTINEAGVKGFAVDGWFGVAMAAKTPDAIVNRIAQEVQAALARAEVKEKLLTLGFDIAYEGPRELRQRIRNEVALWTKLIKDLGIKPE
jgi:tripartite-type tricarboxylate transporter receptor subunit TctC